VDEVVEVVLEVVGALEEVVVDCRIDEVVLEVVGDVKEVVVDEPVEVVELEIEVVEEVVVLVEAAAVYWKVIVPLALFESTAVITYVPVSHAELPPTFVV
jgi:hypothetical protein